MNAVLHGPPLVSSFEMANLPDLLERTARGSGNKGLTWVARNGAELKFSYADLLRESVSGKAVARSLDDPAMPAEGLEFFIELWRMLNARREEPVALDLKTSGSTGESKRIPQTHRALLAFCSAATQGNGLGPEDASLNWMPLGHIGAIADFHLRPIFCGAAQVHVSTEWIWADPLRWFEVIERHQVAVTWAPNFAFGIAASALERSTHTFDLRCLKSVINAGEAVMRDTVSRFVTAAARHRLSSGAIRPTWGMSETCSGMLYGQYDHPGTGPFCDVGRPIPGAAVRVISKTGEVAAEGDVGILEVAGPMVSTGKPARADGARWFDTGDLATISDGRVTIVGRAKEIVVVNGKNFSPAEIQEVAEAAIAPSKGPVSVFGLNRGGSSEALTIVFGTCDASNASLDRIYSNLRQAVSTRFGISPEILIPCGPLEIALTPTGKVQHRKMKERYQSRILHIPKDTEILKTSVVRLPLIERLLELIREAAQRGGRLVLISDDSDEHLLGAALVEAVAQTANLELAPRLSVEVASARRRTPIAINGGAHSIVRGGNYVITGGCGGIGRRLAPRLTQVEGVHVLLLGRTPPRDIHELSRGIQFTQVDIADPNRTADAIRSAFGERGLDGVFHLAAKYGEATLINERADSFDSKLRAKVDGISVIDRVLAEFGNPVFVVFSSAAAHPGLPGLSGYCAANRMAEAYVERRRRAGMMNSHWYAWGPWKNTGMAAGKDTRGAEARGHWPIDPELAIDWMLQMLAAGISGLIVRNSPTCNHDSPAPLRDIPRSDPGAIDSRIRAIWAELLGIEIHKINLDDNFFSLGGHSLLTAELAIRLEKELDIMIPVEVIPGAPTIRALSEHICNAQHARLPSKNL